MLRKLFLAVLFIYIGFILYQFTSAFLTFSSVMQNIKDFMTWPYRYLSRDKCEKKTMSSKTEMIWFE